MKKLILSAAIVLGSLSTFATPISNTEFTAKSVIIAEEFKEIKAEEVPSTVTESLKKVYPEAVITKAYVNENSEYKLEVKVGDKEETLHVDANGKWLEK
ncbi:hypothetical protein [Flavobacterium faecale]|uniref:hypothetical protein n=1 Tax=Flavobacterium faecale TaxID=1355330 RepID=UPI003AAC8ADC